MRALVPDLGEDARACPQCDEPIPAALLYDACPECGTDAKTLARLQHGDGGDE